MSTLDDAAFFKIANYVLGALIALVAILLIAANVIAPDSPPDPLEIAATQERIAPVGRSRTNAIEPAPVATQPAENDVVAAEVASTGTVHTIKMLNSGADGAMVFEPGFVLAQPGDTVVFEPVEQPHNTKSVLVPDGAQEWHGGMNERIELTLNEEGIYIYLCEPHAALAMAGIIQVGDAVNLDAAKAKVEELNQTFAVEKERLVRYLDAVDADVGSDLSAAEDENQEQVAGSNATQSDDASVATVHTIEMLNSGEDGPMVFEPGFILAQPGDTIVFEPVTQPHNTKSVLVPDGAQEWQGGMNERIELTLTEEGIYIYICEPHMALAMAGVIRVGEAMNLDAANAKIEELNATFAVGKDRLGKYLNSAQ